MAVIVPPFLTRLLTPEAYGAWAVALQIGTYVGLFGFGLQMAVGRYVAYAEARDDIAQRDGIVSTAFWFLMAASVVGWLVICGIGFSIEQLLPGLSTALAIETRAAVILVGLALAINLPASIFAAVFTGQHRSDVPAKIQGMGRILLTLGLIAAGFTRNLAVLGLVYAAISILTAATLWYAWRTRTPAPTMAKQHVSRVHGRELAGFCFSLTIWNFAMLLIGGLDIIIVGRWDYTLTAFFAVGVTLVTLLNGTLSSLSNALVPAAASLNRQAGDTADDLLVRASRLFFAASIVGAAPLIFNGYAILYLWLGADYASKAAPILAWLTVGAVVRSAMMPYVTIAIGTAMQRGMVFTPIIEGLLSIIFSIILVSKLGALGVASAKVMSGTFGVLMILAQHPLKAMLSNPSRTNYFWNCVALPSLGWLPVIIVSIGVGWWLPIFIVSPASLILTVTLCITSAWFLVLLPIDRALLSQQLRFRLGVTTASTSSED